MKIARFLKEPLLLSLLFLFFGLPFGTAQAAELKEAVEQLAVQLVKGVPEGRMLRTAVTDFPDLQGVANDLGRYVAERLTTRLAQTPRFRVIERRRLAQVLAELKFGMSDLVDPAKAKQLGRIAGVEALAVGSLSDLGTTVEVDARIIEVETGNMLVAATSTISKDDTVKAMMERGREPSVATTSEASTVSAPPVTRSTLKYQDLPRFRVEVEGLQVTGDGGVTVFLAYINKTQEELTIGLDYPRGKTFAIDSAGNRYTYEGGSGLSGGWHLGSFWEAGTSFLTVPPMMRATASFVLRPLSRIEEKGKNFSFTSEQLFVRMLSDRRNPRQEGTFNITIRNIEPR